MATFDQLSDEQRAIVELVLQRGKSYDELSDMLGMPERRVRELARDALVELAPISARGVEEDWRGQLADYVLGQQAGPEATATRGHLRRSEAARSWTRSLLDSLEQLYRERELPAIPEGERGARRAAAASSADGGAAVRRRRLLAAAGALGLVLLAVLLWPIGLLRGDDDAAKGSAASSTAPTGQASEQPARSIVVQAQALEPSTQTTAYQVWLYNSAQDRKSLGTAVTDRRGGLQSGGEVPANYRDYKFVDITTVTIVGEGQSQRSETGPSVLRGLLQVRDKPVISNEGGNRVALLAQTRLRPLPDDEGNVPSRRQGSAAIVETDS